MLLHEVAYGGEHILSHGRGIASGGVAHGDAVSSTIFEVDMVGANGGSANKLHSATGKQSLVAHGACANDECIGAGYALGCKLFGLKIFHLSYGFEKTLDEWYVAFD